MNIIYGGSFNPPTIAHYQIAKYLMDKHPDASFIFMPTANHYEKRNLLNSSHRVEMLQLVCDRLGKNASVSTQEIEDPLFLGTYTTLKGYPDAYFVMGADNLEGISRWIRYPDIIFENKFFIIPRPGVDLEKLWENNVVLQQARANFIILDDSPYLEVSSSEYRRTKNAQLVLPSVHEYIQTHQLYEEESS